MSLVFLGEEYEKKNKIITEIANVPKNIFRLPVNIWVDCVITYPPHAKRIKFQNNYDGSMQVDNGIPMKLNGEIEYDGKINVRLRDINIIRRFVKNNYWALDKLADSLIKFEDISEYFVKGDVKDSEVEDYVKILNYKVNELLIKNGKDPLPQDVLSEKFNTPNINKIIKPIFVREINRKNKFEDNGLFLELSTRRTGLPMIIWIDENRAYKSTNDQKLRIKFNGLYGDDLFDRDEVFSVDVNGIVYSSSNENDTNYRISDNDFQALVNFFQNNEYALQKIADGETFYDYIGYYLVKGGKKATEREKENLKKWTDYLSADSDNFDDYIKKYKDRLMMFHR